MTTGVLFLIGGVTILFGIALAIGSLESARDAAWRRIAESRRALHEREESARSDFDVDLSDRQSLQERSIDRYWAVDRRRRGSFLLRLAEIETEARRLLDERLGPAQRQLFELRTGLRDLGYWSSEDLATFDRAMIVRNSVVHGDDPIVRGDDEISNADLDRLLGKLKTA